MSVNSLTTDKIQCYVSKPTKARLKRLVNTIPRTSQSSHVELALETYLTMIEHRYGLAHSRKGLLLTKGAAR
jgi:hypothetical protein